MATPAFTFLKGTTPPTPATGKVSLYISSSDGLPHVVNDAGTDQSLKGSDGTHLSVVHDLGNITGATTVDLSLGSTFTASLTGNVTFTFTGYPAAGYIQDFELRLTQDATGGRTATWPASGKWPGGSAFVLTTAANALDHVGFAIDSTGAWVGYPVEAIA